jgi:hypothetical protein
MLPIGRSPRYGGVESRHVISSGILIGCTAINIVNTNLNSNLKTLI